MHEKVGYPIKLGEELPKHIYRFDPGVWIWPEEGYRGGCWLKSTVNTDRTDNPRFGFKHFYTSRESLTIEFKGNYFTLPSGTKFRTWSKFAHPIKLS